MKRFIHCLFVCLLCFLFFIPLSAQDFVVSKDSDFKWRLLGRILFDGGAFFNNKSELGNAVEINDLRLGTQVSFLENWEVKLEIGYAESRVSLKDVYIDYQAGKHLIRLGHYFEPFGNSRVGTTNYRLMTVSGTDKAFGDKRKMGVSYSYNQKYFNFMGGAFSDGDPDNTRFLKGYTLAAKLVGRPLVEGGKLIHIGVAPRFSRHDQDKNKMISFSAGAPTDLLTKESNSFVNAEVINMINLWKLDLEVILLYHKWYFQSQYMLAHVNRFGAPNYTGKGWYTQAGYMILGEKHNYNATTGMMANPAPKSLEIVCRYNRTNLTDRNAGVIGGKMNDVTVGLNYFFNKYIAAKLNYAHVMVGHDAIHGAEDFDLIQARVQFSF